MATGVALLPDRVRKRQRLLWHVFACLAVFSIRWRGTPGTQFLCPPLVGSRHNSYFYLSRPKLSTCHRLPCPQIRISKTISFFAPHTLDTRVRYMLLLTTETRRARREFSCPIGRRRSGKRSQPCGQDLVHRLLHVNGWRQAKELSPKAESLFPGRRLPAREKSPSSVSSVPLW